MWGCGLGWGMGTRSLPHSEATEPHRTRARPSTARPLNCQPDGHDSKKPEETEQIQLRTRFSCENWAPGPGVSWGTSGEKEGRKLPRCQGACLAGVAGGLHTWTARHAGPTAVAVRPAPGTSESQTLTRTSPPPPAPPPTHPAPCPCRWGVHSTFRVLVLYGGVGTVGRVLGRQGGRGQHSTAWPTHGTWGSGAWAVPLQDPGPRDLQAAGFV